MRVGDPLLSPIAALGTVQLMPVIAVPAKNEERRLPLLLAALSGQSWVSRCARPLRVVVVLNNCVDGSRRAALLAAESLPGIDLELIEVDLPRECAHVGSARRIAMERAATLCPMAGGVLLTTDADATPEPDWVDANLRAIANGADLVGGFLYGDPEEEARLGPGFAARASAMEEHAVLCDRLASLVDPLPHDPWPRHRHHTGGSLAIRAGLYRAVGGLPALPRREDVALVARARAAGGKLAHPLDVRVKVSARLSGRAAGGMADCLKDWMRAEAEGSPILVEDPNRWRAHLLRRKAIRELPHAAASERERLAMELGVGPFEADPYDAETMGAFLVERFAPDEPDSPETVAISSATSLLRDMIVQYENANRAA